MPKHILKILFISAGIAILTGCATTQSMMDHFNSQSSSPPPPSNSESLAMNSEFWQGNPTVIWGRLQYIPLQKLETVNASDSTIAGWVKLAMISKRDNNTPQLVQDLMNWRAEYAGHPGNSLFPDNNTLKQILEKHAPQHIALLLPLQGPLAQQGKTVRDGFLNAYYSALSSSHVSQTMSFYDTSQNKNVASLYQKALSEGADFIVGPLTKEDVQSLTKQGSFNTPTLALNYTDSWSLPTNFYEYGLSPIDEEQQLANKAHEAGYSHAIIITTKNDWGQRASKSLSSHWKSNGGTIQEVFYATPDNNLSQSIATLLHVDPNINKAAHSTDVKPEHRHDVDVIFLLTPPQTARQIVPLVKFYYVDTIPIYATSIVNSGSSDLDLEGVVFCDTPWTINGGHGDRLHAVGLDAYTLSNEMPRLTLLPNFPIYGTTGALTLNSQHQVYRRLPWITIHGQF